MVTKAIRVDDEVLAKLTSLGIRTGKGATPNQVLRMSLGLPEKPTISRHLPKDSLSKAKRYIIKAMEELEKAGVK